MLSIAAFSLGAVAIMHIFIASLNRLEHITNRIYAAQVIENRISAVERTLRAYKTLPPDIREDEDLRVGAKDITFRQNLTISAVDNFLDLFRVDFSLAWTENQRTRNFERSAYITDLRLDEK